MSTEEVERHKNIRKIIVGHLVKDNLGSVKGGIRMDSCPSKKHPQNPDNAGKEKLGT